MSVRSFSAIFVVCAFLFAPIAARPADRAPSTHEERTQALEYIQHFQSDPLSPDLKKEIRWVTEWAIEIPDVHVNLCLFVGLPKGDKKHSQTLFTSMLLAQVRFAIEHRDQPSDVNEEYVAGMQGMLRAYEKVVAAFPKDRQPAIDDLIQKRDAGTLPQYIRERSATACKKNG
jgi:hypothetical protein